MNSKNIETAKPSKYLQIKGKYYASFLVLLLTRQIMLIYEEFEYTEHVPHIDTHCWKARKKRKEK